MRVAHIVGPDISGGAARGALWLHEALLNNNIDSHLIVKYSSEKDQDYKNIKSLIQKNSFTDFLLKADRLYLRAYPNRTNEGLFTPGIKGSLLSKIDDLDSFDLIHLHWINAGILKIEDLSKIKKPIIWTIRDMWPFTGGCHYSLDCKNYKNKCGSCPQLGSKNKHDLSSKTYSLKEDNFGENIYPVAISPWLKKEMSDSTHFKNKNINMIFNGINLKSIKKIDKKEARKSLDINSDKIIIGIGAINLVDDLRKGFSHFVDALKSLDKDIEVIIFGSNHLGRYSINQKTTLLGNLDNNHLSNFYSAIDVFVAPSIQEAFGKTIVEAMNCGTPVVSFDNTGPKDIIVEGKNGYLAEYGNSNDLVKKINQAIDLSKECSDDCISHVKENFDLDKKSKEYIELYNRILN